MTSTTTYYPPSRETLVTHLREIITIPLTEILIIYLRETLVIPLRGTLNIPLREMMGITSTGIIIIRTFEGNKYHTLEGSTNTMG